MMNTKNQIAGCLGRFSNQSLWFVRIVLSRVLIGPQKLTYDLPPENLVKSRNPGHRHGIKFSGCCDLQTHFLNRQRLTR